ncbi:MAG: SixA phosphatase family protein [Parafannyhessea sp.]|uniref:SixA phosphatase family protein n=1 Tax=Parafannyhessea sp. TaxID=2847324 RepID=UPI003F05C8F0
MVSLLVLVRHGDAEPKGADGDKARRLTPEGLKRLRKSYPSLFADFEARGSLELWVSPAVRAQMTAEVVADALGVDANEAIPHESLYDQDDEAFLGELRASDAGTIVAVGHVPFMRDMVEWLCGEDLPFHKGAVAAIEFPTGRIARGEARLLWLREA